MIIFIVTNSEKVFRRGLLCRYATRLLWRRGEHFVVPLVKFIELEDCCNVATSITVIRRRPDRHQCLIKHLFVTLHDELVRPRYQLRPILLIEHFDTILPKDVASTSWTYTPALNFLRVAPHQVAHGSFVRHLLLSIDRLDLIKSVYVGAQTAMHAEDLLVHDCRQG